MLTLAIEASNPSASGSSPGVAVGRLAPRQPGSAELLDTEPLRSTARHDDDLLPAIDRLWKRLAAAGRVAGKRDLALVAVSCGPGGFTGLRVATAAAKLIAEAVGARCIAVPSASVAAARVAPDLPRPFAVLLASKRDTSIATVFAADGSTPIRNREIDAGAIESLAVGALVADAFLPEPIRRRCQALGLRIDEPVFDPGACLEAAAALEPVDPAHLLPIYGREPEAVRKWRELHG